MRMSTNLLLRWGLNIINIFIGLPSTDYRTHQLVVAFSRPSVDNKGLLVVKFQLSITRMKYASHREKKEREVLEENVGYAEGSIREYLNIKRTSKDRCCTVFFCLYMVVLIILTGIGFFYGNFSKIGIFLANGIECTQFLSYSAATDTYACDLTACNPPSTYALLQRVCVPSSYTDSAAGLGQQINAQDFHQTLGLQIYMNIGVLVGCLLIFSLLVCYPKLVYPLFFLAFALLLSLPFLLLKNNQDRTQSLLSKYSSDPSFSSSQLLSDQRTLQPLAYLLLAFFLVLLPMGLFGVGKVKMGVNLLAGMWDYFQRNYTVIIFSMVAVLGIYVIIFVLAFLLLNFLTGGTIATKTNSFFYLYEKVSLYHPAALAFFYIGAVWLVGTFGVWHQHVVCSSVVQWYFEDGGKFKPVRKGMKRGWYNLGSHALAAFLTPLEWIALLLYSLVKVDPPAIELPVHQNEHSEDCGCLSGCLLGARQQLVKLYLKINRSSVVAQALTNNGYTQSCELAAVTFSQRSHRFFNIGGALTTFFTLFTCALFLGINYLPLYYQNYDVFPPRVTSLSLQLILAVALGLGTGHLLSGLLATSVDALIFCFLMQKKGGDSLSEKEIKKALEELYAAEDEREQVTQMYEVDSDID